MVDSSIFERSEIPDLINIRSLTRAPSIAQQSADTASIQTERDPDDLPLTFEELPGVTIDTKNGRMEYIKAELLNIKIDRRSWIWAHKYDLVEVNTKVAYWICRVRKGLRIS